MAQLCRESALPVVFWGGETPHLLLAVCLFFYAEAFVCHASFRGQNENLSLYRRQHSTMSFSVKLNVSQPHLPQLPPSVANNNVRSPAVTLASQFTQNSFVGLKYQLPISITVDEVSNRSQIEELVDLLRDSADRGSIKEAKAVHGYVLKSGFVDEDFLVLLNHILRAYCKCSDYSAACLVFDKMFQRNNVSWTTMISGSTENGFYLDGFWFFYEMLDRGFLPDKFTFSAIIQTCIGLDSLELGKMVHAQVTVRGFACHTFVSTAMLNMYSKLGEIESSCLVFSSMTEKNVVSWNAMISGFTSNGFYLAAFDNFLRMKNEGITPNMYTVVSVSKAVGKLGDVEKGREVHLVASILGVESTVLVGTALVDMYSKCGSLNDARAIFDKNFVACGVNMPWNSMISGYSQCGYSQEALKVYVTMCQEDIKPDLYTFGSIFSAIAALKNLRFGKEVHAMGLKYGDGLIVTNVQNAIADAYSKCGSLEDVVKVFDRMKERDIVSWTTMVTAYSHCSEWEEALSIFSQMREDGFAPNLFTFSSVFASCASLCLLDYGRQVHGILCKAGLDCDLCIESALIDMFAKCGSIADAEKVFKRIPSPDNVSLTAMISAYAQHGFTEDALCLFTRMEQLGMKPTAVTLLCVLSACSHGGMVAEGLRYFKLMEEKYDLELDMEHYACVVDLLGRVGRLDDAMEFIRSMPITPNEIIWQTLLGACRIHGNIELGEIAALKVLSARPDHSAAYVLLSNTYIETGSLADGHFLRDVMKKRGVKKEPGYSWICIEGGLHRFYAGDERHPEKNVIYTALDDLNKKVKSMSCAISLSCTL